MNFLFSSKKPSKDLIKKYEQMGFDKETTKRAWKACKGDEKKILDHMISLNQPKQVVVTQEPIIPVIENKSIVKSKSKPEESSFIKERPAVKAPSVSFKPQPTMKTTYEPMNAEQRIRPDGLPVGLKNVGNTCYVNSLFQAYFMSETFVSSILRYDPRVTLVNDYLTASSAKKEEDDSKRIRIEASIKLIKNLQKLFAKMIKSHKRYIDPTEVLDSVVDDTGQIITVGNQRDITEYHLNFLSRVEDAFFYQDKFLESMREDGGRPIQLKDLPESYTTSATLRNRFQNEASSLSVPENSLITNHFFGRMKQVMTYTVNDEQGMEEKELVVGPIILDVLNKDLYTALEAYCNFTIDDYQAPSGEVTAAKGQIWITKPPELLFVQLNRVSYDKKTNMPVKINQAFEFEKEIFMDRFLLDCRDEAHLINRRIASLKTELAQKESALQKLMTSFESKNDIIHVFSFMENFLKKQIAYEGSPASRTDPDPTLVGMLEEVDKMSIAADIITSYRLHFESKVSELKSSINTIKKTINKLWSKLNKRKYHLVSILIHEGDAESGHYYSFNRNVQRDTWKRFNDHHVSEEKEEVVLTEALGGFGNMSAYCLVYVSDENIQEELNLNTTELKDLFAREEVGVDVEKHYYKKLLTPILTQEVIADNISFQDEVEEFQTTAYVKLLVEKYKSRYNMVSKALQTKSSSSPPVHLNSFSYFLKADSYCEGALKWYILDSVLQTSQDSCPIKDIPKLSLKNLKDLPQLFLKLQQQVSSLPKPFNLSSLTLTSQIENQLEIKLAEYNAEYPVLIYIKFILKSFLNENWQEACYATKLFFNIEKSEKSYLFKLVRDCTKVVCLWMALKAENYMKQSQTEEFSNIMLYLTALSKGVLKAEEAHTYQIKTIFLEFLNESQDFITDDDRAVLKDQFQRLSQTSNTIAELDKVVENYESVVNKEDLQRKLKMLSMKDMSNWKDTDENLPSTKLKKLVEKFRFNLQMIVEFHNKISETKTILNSVDRKRHGFVIL